MTLTLKVLIGVALILIAAFAAVTNTGASGDPQIVHLNLTDSQLRVSQFVVTADKPVKFEIANEGAIPHHLLIQRMGAPLTSAGDGPVVGTHTTQVVEQTLPAGIYRVFCDLFDHADRGMSSAIAAEKAPRAAYPISMSGFVSSLIFILGCVYIISDSLGIRLMRSGDRAKT